jgi:glucose-6-phosphate 1-epimerase
VDSARTQFFGLDSVLLKAPDGASAIVTCYGAQVVSWIPTGDDERLFLSPKSALDKLSPIRGGVPVVFPQFATYGSLPNHGLVRTRDWRVVVVDIGEHGARATFRVEDSSDTRKVWPHAFACELRVAVSGVRLELQLRIENPGPRPFDFCAALHTYLRVTDIHEVRLEGLYGARYRDRTDHDREIVDSAHPLTISAEVDRVYVDAPNQLVIRERGRSLSVHANGFPDVVVWNPWKDKCALLDDMPNDGYQHMLCVEAAAVGTRATLGSGGSWTGGQMLIASN